jgi:signal transduction histidine kinase
MAFLVDLRRGHREIIGMSLTIGRDPANTIAIGDPAISRKHATICRTPEGRFLLVDLGSTSGTFIAGRRVSEAVLNDGDEIRIGAARLCFENPPTRGSIGEDVRLSSTVSSPHIHRRISVAPDAQRVAGGAKDLQDLRRDHDRLDAALELTRAIGVEHDLPKLLERILIKAVEFLGAERGAILLLDADSGQLGTRIARRRDGGREHIVLSSSLLGEAMRLKQGIISADATSDARFSGSESILAQGIRSAMCVPILHLDEVFGVLHLDSRSEANAFVDKDLELFVSIASQAGLAIKNAVLIARAQSAMAEELDRLARVIRHLPEGVLLLGAGGKIVLCNPLAGQVLPVLTAAREGDVLTHLGEVALADILASGAGTAKDVVVPGPPQRTFSISGTSWSEASSEVETVVLIRDATAEREQERQALRQDRLALVGQLAGTLAHDFNNMLTVVRSCASSLAADVADSFQRENADEILAATERASDLVRQLLTFSRTGTERISVVELTPLIEGVEQLLRRAISPSIRFETQLAADVWPIHADPRKLEQALMNLVVNARDAMPDGGTLTIATTNVDIPATATPPSAPSDGLAAGRYVLCSVTDTGVGMTPDVLARAFEPFFTTKDVGKGTGLGLASVRRIVEQIGGAISLRSAPGAGATISMYLPVIAPEGAR